MTCASVSAWMNLYGKQIQRSQHFYHDETAVIGILNTAVRQKSFCNTIAIIMVTPSLQLHPYL